MSIFFIIGLVLVAIAIIASVAAIAGIIHSFFTDNLNRIPYFIGMFLLCVMFDAIGMLTIGGGIIDFVTTRF